MEARISSFFLVLLKQLPQGDDELLMDFINLSAPRNMISET
jgi:hypothetical protein